MSEILANLLNKLQEKKEAFDKDAKRLRESIEHLRTQNYMLENVYKEELQQLRVNISEAENDHKNKLKQMQQEQQELQNEYDLKIQTILEEKEAKLKILIDEHQEKEKAFTEDLTNFITSTSHSIEQSKEKCYNQIEANQKDIVNLNIALSNTNTNITKLIKNINNLENESPISDHATIRLLERGLGLGDQIEQVKGELLQLIEKDLVKIESGEIFTVFRGLPVKVIIRDRRIVTVIAD